MAWSKPGLVLEAEAQASLVRGVWGCTGGARRDFTLSCPLTAASLVSCEVLFERWVQLHFAVRATLASDRWSATVNQSLKHTPVWLVCGLPCIDEGRESKSGEVARVWETCEDRLRFTSAMDVKVLQDALRCQDLCAAWEAWSSAADGAVIDAYCSAGGPVPMIVVREREE